MNLSISDLLTCAFAPFFLHVIVIAKLDSLFRLLVSCFGNVSHVSIFAISIDRCLLVAYPLKHRLLMRGKVIILSLPSIWISGVAVPISLQLFSGDKMNSTLAIHCFAAALIVLYALMYAIMYSTLKKHSKNIFAQQISTESRAQKIRILKEKNFLQTIILIAMVSFFCTIPSLIYFQLRDSLHFSADNLTTEILFEILIYIFFINYAVNPLIYVLRLPNYRKTFYLIYCKSKS